MADFFPELNDSFLGGQDVFYAQFNSINFYVEDEDQEHFYYNLLQKLFPDIEFSKIFPLNGKTNVIEDAKVNTLNNNKVYLLDLDFDEILDQKENEPNIFYLKRYSIENYLINEKAIFEMIREGDPKLKNQEIAELFELEEFIITVKKLLPDLTMSFILIQKYSLGKKYFGLNPARDFNFNPASYRGNEIQAYLDEVELLLKNIDGRYTLNSQIRIFKHHFKSPGDTLNNVPGKYILALLMEVLKKEKLVPQMTLETFTYKLAKDSDLSDLEFLKTDVESFISS